jgi:small-conductance mechanosensitive channel
MIELLRKYCQQNIKGLQHMGVGYESALMVMNFHLNNISVLITIVFSGALSLFEIDREIIGVIGIVLLVCLYILFWGKRKVIFEEFPTKVTTEDSKAILILFTIFSHLIVIVFICVIGYYFFGK